MKLLTLHLYPLMALTSLFGTVAIPAHSQPIIPAADGTGTTVNQNGNQFNIQGGTPSSNSSNLFHSFTQFNVESGQTANFLTTPDIRNILGRVTGGNASTINGLIQVVGGNSNLFLMNPAGVLFGPNASLNVPASFSVTTATGIGFNGNNFWFKAMGTNDYSNLVGNPSGYHFDVSNPGAIVNEGSLSLNPGNNLTLAGGTVVNTGELSTAGGNITIAAVNGGDTLRISQPGHVLSLDVSPSSANLSGESITPLSLAQLLTGGEISHASSVMVDAQGNLVLTGTEGVAVASGNIDVSTTSTPPLSKGGEGGTISPLSKGGEGGYGSPLSKGGQGGYGIGGQINVLGDRVAVIDANIQANGLNGGGTVLIGGDFQGSGIVPNSEQTFVNNNSFIYADAIDNGNGGQVIIWSDDTTNFAGNISATGGEFYGDGGFVEISGKQELIFDGNVNVGAALGEVGTILFDPKNIIIGAEIGDVNEEDNQTLSLEAIAELEGNIQLQADNDITVNQPIETSKSIELKAGRSININADIDTSNGNSNITLFGNYSENENDNGVDINNRDSGAASINQTEGTTLNAGSGDITIKLGSLGENGDINLANLTTTGQVLINANRGNISRVSPNSLITADRAILETGSIGGVGLAEAPLRIDVNNLEVLTGDKGVFIESISNLIIGGVNDNDRIKGIDNKGGGDIELNINGNLTVTEQISTSAPDSQPGNITISSSGNIDTTQITINAKSESTSGGDVLLSADGDIKTGLIDVSTEGSNRGGNITINSGGEVDTTAGRIKSASLDGDGGKVAITSNGNLTTGNINSSADGAGNGGDITLESTGGNVDTSSEELASFSRGGNAGNVSITSQGNITTGDIFSSAGDPLDVDGDLEDSTSNTNSDQNGSGSGGDITLTAEGTIDTSAGTIESFSRLSAGGTVSITTKGDITTGGVFSTAGEPTEGASVTTEGTTQGEINSSNSGNITIESTEGAVTTTAEIDTAAVGGNAGSVTIKAFGDIKTESIESSTFGGDGGDITIESTSGSIDTTGVAGDAEIFSLSNQGNAGNVIAKSNGNLITGKIDSNSDNGRGGNITLESTGGNVDTSISQLSSFSDVGDAGDVNIKSLGDIKTGNVNSETQGGTGGDITLESTGGNIDSSSGELASSSSSGNAGNISLTSQGDIKTGNVSSFAGEDFGETEESENSGSGDGGDITLKAGGSIDTTAGTDGASNLESFSRDGSGGNIILEAKGDITIGRTLSTAGNPENDSDTLVTTQTEGNGGSSGDISITSTEGAVTTTAEINSFATNGDGGSVTIESFGDLNIGNEINSRSDSNGDGGDISLASQTGAVDMTTGAIESFSRQGAGGDITIIGEGDINIGNNEAGDETTGLNSEAQTSSDGGDIFIESNTGVITINSELSSFSGTGNGGDINIKSFGDLIISNIDSRSDGNGNGGNIILSSTSGSIDTSIGFLRSFSESGNAGDVDITSNLDLITGDIDSRSNGSGEGGSITLESTGGNIDSSSGELSSSSLNGNAGTVSLTSQGNITTGNISSFAGQDRGEAEDEDSENSVSGNGGDITLKAGGTIDTTAGTEDESSLESFSRDGSGGNIILEAKGDVTTGTILSTAGDPDNDDTIATTQTQIDGARSGDISIKSTEGTVTTTAEINSFATTGDGGDITIESFGDINISNNETEDEPRGIDSRADTSSDGGDIFIESNTGVITINSELSSSSGTGDGGEVNIKSFGDLSTSNLDSRSDGNGNGGNIILSSTSGSIDTSSGELSSFSELGNAGYVNITSNLDLITGEIDSRSDGSGNGGSITLESTGGNVNTRSGLLRSFSESGNAGDVNITSNLNLRTGDIDSRSNGSGNGGSITLESTGGNVNTSSGEFSSFSLFGDAGDVNITSSGNLTTGDIDSRSNGSGQGGSLILESTGGNIDTRNGSLSSFSVAGDAGDVNITSSGNLNTGDIDSRSGIGKGGNITLESTGGNVDTSSGFLSSFSQLGNAGNVTISSNGNLTTGEIFSSSGDPVDSNNDIPSLAELTELAIAEPSLAEAVIEQQINNLNFRENTSGSGGNITLKAEGEINTTAGVIESFSREGSGGSITIEANGNIITSEIISSAADPENIPTLGENTETTNQSEVEEPTSRQSGNIKIESTEGTVTTQGEITSYSNNGNAGNIEIIGNGEINIGEEEGFIDSRADTSGNGGTIKIESKTGAITINSELSSSSQTGDGGDVEITATGNINTGTISSFSEGNGNGGNITLKSTSGNIDTTSGQLGSFSGEEIDETRNLETIADENQGGQGGNITLEAEGEINAGDIESFSREGSGGSITIEANGNIITSEIISSAADPENIPTLGENTETTNQSEVEEPTSRQSGNIKIESTEGTVTTQGEITSYSNNGNAGNIEIIGNGEINIGEEEGFIDSRADTSGNGGTIKIESKTGAITINSELSSSSQTGDGGDVEITATGNINTGTISSFSEGNGNGGNITLKSTSGNIDTTSGQLGSFSGEEIDETRNLETIADENQGGQGGNITLEAEGEINAGDIESFSREGSGGSITIEANGNIITSEIISSAADPENIP
ncbi:MAG: filamentous hemagglutinin N-terminal domain-containing protein, partial [Okeania sp. SIO3I5]|uniref:beta strand repeat-containing protein n=1 Tax=Okeania sp. SIO3I5 TaxID=2607805 RepID=UPI0013BAE04B